MRSRAAAGTPANLREAIAQQYDFRNTTASLARVFRDWLKSRIFEVELKN
jgi:uncharacterized protein YjiS (DUF1127 family)